MASLQAASWALLLAVAFGSNSLLDNDAQVISLEEDMDVLDPPADYKYHKIPGLLMTTNSRAGTAADTKGKCQSLCNREPNCKSFSFNPTDKKCMWSSDSLKYDPDFTLNIKPTSAEETKYMSIAGMYNADRDWTKTEGRTQEQCEVLCDKGASCKMYAYRQRDNLCMMTPDTLGLNEHFNYYEKEGVADSSAGFPDRPAGSNSNITGATEASDGQLKGQIVSEQNQLNKEKQEVAKAQGDVVRIKQEAAEQEKTLGDKAKEEAMLKEKFAQVKEWSTREMAAQKQEGELNEKTNEVKAKGAAIKANAKAAAASAETQAVMSEEAAKVKADLTVKGAEQEAKEKLDEAKLTSEKAVARTELAKAGEVKTEAQKKMTADQVKIDLLEAENKKQQTDYDLKMETMANETRAENQKIAEDEKAQLSKVAQEKAEAVAEAKRKVIAKQETKTAVQLTEMAERQTKEDIKEKAVKESEKLKGTQRKEEVDNLKKNLQAARDRAIVLQKSIAEAKVTEAVSIARANLERKKAAAKAKGDLLAAKAKAKEEEEESQARIRALKRSAAEKVRKTQRAEEAQIKDHKEGKSKLQINMGGAQVEATAQTEMANVKEVANKASKLPDAEAATMIEKAKTEFRDNIKNAETQDVTMPTKYVVSMTHSEFASVSNAAAPAPAQVELGESAAPDDSVQQLQPNNWPMDVPCAQSRGTDCYGKAVTDQAQYDLKDSLAASVRGYMSAEMGDVVKVSFVKFPVEPLPEGDTLDGVSLTFDKVAETDSATPATVAVTSCDYESDNVSFETRPASLATLTTDQTFPSAKGPAKISLNPLLVKQYLAGKTLCLEIGGGGSDFPVLYNNPQIQLAVAKPAPAIPAPFPLETGVTVDRRRRSALKMKPKSTKDEAAALTAEAIKKKQAIADEVEPDLEHKMKLDIPVALQAKKEAVCKELRVQDQKVRKMKIEVLNTDPLIPERILQEEKAKANTELAVKIQEGLPKRVAKGKAELIETEQSKIRDAITAAEENKSRLFTAKQTPIEVKKALALMKEQKLKAIVVKEPTAKQVQAGIAEGLAKFKTDTSPKLDAQAKKLAAAQTKEKAEKSVAELPATKNAVNTALAKAAKDTVALLIDAALVKKMKETVETHLALAKIEFKKANKGAAPNAGQLATLTAAANVKATKGGRKAIIKKNLIKKMEDDQKQKLRANIAAKVQANALPQVIAKMKTETANLAAANLATELKRQMDVKEKALKVAWNIKYMQEQASTANSTAQVSQAEADALSEQVTKSITRIERNKTNIEIAKKFEAAIEGEKFTQDIANKVGVVTIQATKDLTEEIKPALMKVAEATAETRTTAELKVKKEKILAKMDLDYEKECEEKSATVLLLPGVMEALKKKLAIQVALTVQREAGVEMSKSDLLRKLKKATRDKYWEGTLKTSKAYVEKEFRPTITDKFEDEAKTRAKLIVKTNAAPEITKAIKLLEKSIMKKRESETAPKLAIQVKEATNEMDPSDIARVTAMLTKENEDANKKEAAEQAKAKTAPVAKMVEAGLMSKTMPKEVEKAKAKIEKELEKKVHDVAEAAIQQKIKEDVAKVEATAVVRKVPDIDTALRTQQEKQMVDAAGAAQDPGKAMTPENKNLQIQLNALNKNTSAAQQQQAVLKNNMQVKEQAEAANELKKIDDDEKQKQAAVAAATAPAPAPAPAPAKAAPAPAPAPAKAAPAPAPAPAKAAPAPAPAPKTR